jgi:dipeptidyl aminopeptidase/acylaminoacyl peptidase
MKAFGSAGAPPFPEAERRGPPDHPPSRPVDVWVYELERGILTRLSFGEDDSAPARTRDGRRVAWSSTRGGRNNLFWKPADGSGPDELLTTSEHAQFPCSFSPDGKALLFLEIDPSTGDDLWILPLEGERTPRLFLQTPFKGHQASISPDGQRFLMVKKNEDQPVPQQIIIEFVTCAGRRGRRRATREASRGRECRLANHDAHGAKSR